MTFLLQSQKLFVSNAWNLTKFIRGHDSKTSTFSQTTTLYSAAGVLYSESWPLINNLVVSFSNNKHFVGCKVCQPRVDTHLLSWRRGPGPVTRQPPRPGRTPGRGWGWGGPWPEAGCGSSPSGSRRGLRGTGWWRWPRLRPASRRPSKPPTGPARKPAKNEENFKVSYCFLSWNYDISCPINYH